MLFLRRKTITCARRTLAPLALNAEPAGRATGSPGTDPPGNSLGSGADGWGTCPVTEKPTQGHCPLAPVPRALGDPHEGLAQVEDPLLSSRSCSTHGVKLMANELHIFPEQ